jgi:hypothetical protein
MDNLCFSELRIAEKGLHFALYNPLIINDFGDIQRRSAKIIFLQKYSFCTPDSVCRSPETLTIRQTMKGVSNGNNTETMSRFRTVQEFEILYLQMPRVWQGERNLLG